MMSILSRTKVKNPAIAFDVDETLIMWHPTDNDKVITRPIVHQLFNHAARIGYQIFIITARMSSKNGMEYMTRQLLETGYNLKGIVPSRGMYMTPKEFADDEHPGRFKSYARDHLQKKFGVTLVAMVGDKYWDMLADGEAPNESLDKTDCHIIVNPDKNVMYGLKLNLEDKKSESGKVDRHGSSSQASSQASETSASLEASLLPPTNSVLA